MFVDECKRLIHHPGQVFPVLRRPFAGLVEEMHRHAVRPFKGVVLVVGVGGPDKVAYVRGLVVVSNLLTPAAGVGCVTVTNFFGILQVARSTNHVVRINGDFDIKVAPDAVKLAPHVRVSVPALVVVLRHFRVPLRHGIANAFLVIPTGTTNLQRHLRFPVHDERSRITGQNRLVQVNFQDSPHRLVLHRPAVLRQATHADVPNLIGLQFANPVPHPTVGVGQRQVAYVHHASRLKGVEVQVVKRAV